MKSVSQKAGSRPVDKTLHDFCIDVQIKYGVPGMQVKYGIGEENILEYRMKKFKQRFKKV